MNTALQVNTVKLLDGATATGAGDEVVLPSDYQSFQIEGITTATVKIQATNDLSTWDDLATITSDGSYTHEGVFAKYRANVTAYTSGTINVTATYRVK